MPINQMTSEESARESKANKVYVPKSKDPIGMVCVIVEDQMGDDEEI